MFTCRAEVTHHFQDRDNYPTSRLMESTQLTADTLEELYEKAAAYHIDNTTGVEEQYGDYYVTDFETIYEIASIQAFDEFQLQSSDTWIDHSVELAAKAEEERRIEEQRQAKQAKKAEEKAMAEYLRLRAIYGESK